MAFSCQRNISYQFWADRLQDLDLGVVHRRRVVRPVVDFSERSFVEGAYSTVGKHFFKGPGPANEAGVVHYFCRTGIHPAEPAGVRPKDRSVDLKDRPCTTRGAQFFGEHRSVDVVDRIGNRVGLTVVTPVVGIEIGHLVLVENSRGYQPIDENALQVWKGCEVVERCDSTPLGFGSNLGRIHVGSKLWC